MKAIVFAAGLGTRLRPLTLDRPKALVEVGGMTMLERVMRRLVSAGVSDIIVNVHHFADKVIGFLDHVDVGVPVHVSDERGLLLDTGGGLLAARRWLDGDDFIVHNADIFSDIPLDEMIKSHAASGADATLLTAGRASSRCFLFEEGRLCGWRDCRSGVTMPARLDSGCMGQLAFGGIHVLSPGIWEPLERYGCANGPVFSITPFYIAESRNLDIRAWMQPAGTCWLDVGKPDTLAAARSLFS